MKKIFNIVLSITLLFFSVVSLFARGSSSGTEKPVELKLGHLANTEHDWHKSLVYFAERVQQKTQGKVQITIYPNEELGNELDNINAIGLGSADMVLSGESLQNWAPLAALIATPYAISSSQDMKAIVEGKVGEAIMSQVREKVGLVHIAWFERAPRNLTSNRPIRSPQDLNNLVMRVPNVPLFVTAWKAMGAKPTTMAFSEVFTSLQQGTIEAQENPLDLIKSASFYEVQKYVNETEHVRGWMSLWLGEKQYKSLSPEYQQAIIEAGKEAQDFYRPLFDKSVNSLKAELQTKGMEFISVDQKAFQDLAGPAITASLTPEQKALFETIRNMR